jgi:RHS repeat-associated protein
MTRRATQTFNYDVHNRLTTGPQGTYTYGGSQLDAMTSTSGGDTSAYDTAGSMTCRAPTSSTTCSGTPSGQTMAYDQLRRMLTWQNTPSSPTQTASYVYDGEGERVQQAVTASGTTTTTSYIGGYEEYATNGTTNTTTKYYPMAVSVNGTVSYIVSDGLSSVSGALDTAGNVTAAALYAPYGATRYSVGTMPTARSFTGMVGDPSGLSYDHARYYDGVVGQFTTADTVQGPNRYGYVAGNPETMTDPTGQRLIDPGNGTSFTVSEYAAARSGGSSGGSGSNYAHCADGSLATSQAACPPIPKCSGCNGPKVQSPYVGCSSSSQDYSCWGHAVAALETTKENSLDGIAWLSALGALFLNFLAITYDVGVEGGINGLKDAVSSSHILETVLDFLMEGLVAAGFVIGHLLGNGAGSFIRGALVLISNALHAILGVLNVAIAAYTGLGWFGGIANTLVTAAERSAGGPVGFVITLVSSIAGPVLMNLINVGAEALMVNANLAWQQSQSISDSTGDLTGDISFCNTFGGCPPLPTN